MPLYTIQAATSSGGKRMGHTLNVYETVSDARLDMLTSGYSEVTPDL